MSRDRPEGAAEHGEDGGDVLALDSGPCELCVGQEVASAPAAQGDGADPRPDEIAA